MKTVSEQNCRHRQVRPWLKATKTTGKPNI